MISACNSTNLHFDRAAILIGSQREFFAAVAHCPVDPFLRGATVKEIPLNHGKVALVDDADYDRVIRYSDRWLADLCKSTGIWYVRSTHGVRLHRFILNAPAECMVDHKDRDGLNNQRHNLRLCTNTQNQANAKPRSGGTSVFKGVCWYPNYRKWLVSIRIQGVKTFIGYFADEVEAARAYDEAALKHFGEFARPNFPKGD